MLGVFDTVWNKAVPQARDLLDNKSQRAYAAMVTDAAAMEYGRIASRADTMTAHASFPVDLIIRWGRYNTTAQNPTLFNQVVPGGEERNYLKFRSLMESAPHWGLLGQTGTRFNAVSGQDTVALWRGGGNADELVRLEQTNTNTLRQIRQDAQSLVNTIRQGDSRYRALENQYPNSGSLTYIGGVNTAATALVNAIIPAEDDSSVRRYTIANGAMDTRIRAREEEFRQGGILFQGTMQGEDYLIRYPTRAAEQLARMDTAIEADRQALEALIRQYNAEPPEIARSINPLREDAVAMQRRLEQTRSQGRAMATSARAQSADAANLRREGDRLFAEAQAALARNDFDIARNRVNRAGDAYFHSLEREHDEPTLAKRNTDVINLDEAIAVAYNQDVIRQVNELVPQIQNSYFSGDIEQAERLVTRAQNTWRLTQQELDHPDLVYWAMMIQAASRSDRTISPTAPLYAEMSQLLSEARRNFEEGRILYVSSQREGTRILNAARQNLEKVKLVYPMSEEAGILDLRIDQVLDPNFDATFGAKVQETINRTKTGSPTARNQAYAELLNYQAVFPRFANWGPIITEAEYDIGRRPRPPSPESIARAAELVASVRDIVRSGNADRIEEILPRLTEAMQLDPTNQEARNLFTQATLIVRAGQTQIDVEAERLYQQALQALVQQNTVRVRQLLQEIYARDPVYRHVPKIVTLRQRVEAM
jgi:Txe/YoeB family toxin of Txe-Axe toxin-antitoxin module